MSPSAEKLLKLSDCPDKSLFLKRSERAPERVSWPGHSSPSLAFLASSRSAEHTTIRFVNKSGTDARVLWMSFEGEEVAYSTIPSGCSKVYRSFKDHLWVAREAGTGRRMLLNGAAAVSGGKEPLEACIGRVPALVGVGVGGMGGMGGEAEKLRERAEAAGMGGGDLLQDPDLGPLFTLSLPPVTLPAYPTFPVADPDSALNTPQAQSTGSGSGGASDVPSDSKVQSQQQSQSPATSPTHPAPGQASPQHPTGASRGSLDLPSKLSLKPEARAARLSFGGASGAGGAGGAGGGTPKFPRSPQILPQTTPPSTPASKSAHSPSYIQAKFSVLQSLGTASASAVAVGLALTGDTSGAAAVGQSAASAAVSDKGGRGPGSSPKLGPMAISKAKVSSTPPSNPAKTPGPPPVVMQELSLSDTEPGSGPATGKTAASASPSVLHCPSLPAAGSGSDFEDDDEPEYTSKQGLEGLRPQPDSATESKAGHAGAAAGLTAALSKLRETLPSLLAAGATHAAHAAPSLGAQVQPIQPELAAESLTGPDADLINLELPEGQAQASSDSFIQASQASPAVSDSTARGAGTSPSAKPLPAKARSAPQGFSMQRGISSLMSVGAALGGAIKGVEAAIGGMGGGAAAAGPSGKGDGSKPDLSFTPVLLPKLKRLRVQTSDPGASSAGVAPQTIPQFDKSDTAGVGAAAETAQPGLPHPPSSSLEGEGWLALDKSDIGPESAAKAKPGMSPAAAASPLALTPTKNRAQAPHGSPLAFTASPLKKHGERLPALWSSPSASVDTLEVEDSPDGFVLTSERRSRELPSGAGRAAALPRDALGVGPGSGRGRDGPGGQCVSGAVEDQGWTLITEEQGVQPRAA